MSDHEERLTHARHTRGCGGAIHYLASQTLCQRASAYQT